MIRIIIDTVGTFGLGVAMFLIFLFGFGFGLYITTDTPASLDQISMEFYHDASYYKHLKYTKTYIRFGKTFFDRVSICRYFKDFNVVTISPETLTYSYDGFKNLVYHELGHCALNMRHLDTRVSIMNSVSWESVSKDFNIMREQFFTIDYFEATNNPKTSGTVKP